MLNEQNLILTTVLIDKTEGDVKAINGLLTKSLDWSYIAGQIINHRLGGYFYLGLSGDQVEKMPKELKASLQLLIKAQEVLFRKKISEFIGISSLLDEGNIRYAAIKGLVFCADMYSFAHRRSDDLDIFVIQDDLIKLDTILKKYGYIQAYVKNGEYVSLTNSRESVQLLNDDDTILYVKLIDSKHGVYAELDINFMPDKTNNPICDDIYAIGLKTYSNNEVTIKGLPFTTHLIFLCINFHREGNNCLYIKGRQSIVLYKLVDIYNLIRSNINDFIIDDWCDLALKYNIAHKCLYTFKVIQQYYPSDLIIDELVMALKSMPELNQNAQEDVTREANSEFQALYDDSFNWVM